MISAGNDVVSLGAATNARAKQSAFYKKILTESEINLYNNFNEFITLENYVWLLWSVKEAAYKYLQRFETALVFSPVRFVVQLLTPPLEKLDQNFGNYLKEGIGFNHKQIWAGTVTYKEHTLFSRSVVDYKTILSTVNSTENFEQVYWGIKDIGDISTPGQSEAVRSFLLAQLKSIYPGKLLYIGKNKNNIPVILNGMQELSVPVSLSHHEQYVAYAFYLNINKQNEDQNHHI